MSTYRVTFKKNNGHGKRTRVNFTANSLSELIDLITDKAKEDRMRPMRAQKMNGSTIIAKFKINTLDDEYDIIKANDRAPATYKNTNNTFFYNKKTADKITKKNKKTLQKSTNMAAAAKAAALADMSEEGLVFDID